MITSTYQAHNHELLIQNMHVNAPNIVVMKKEKTIFVVMRKENVCLSMNKTVIFK